MPLDISENFLGLVLIQQHLCNEGTLNSNRLTNMFHFESGKIAPHNKHTMRLVQPQSSTRKSKFVRNASTFKFITS